MKPSRANRLEDRLGPLEPPYRSGGEAQIGRVLDRYGIPFFYRQAALIYDRGEHRIWRPDFTLPTYNGLIIEYAGTPDVRDYAKGVRHRHRTYIANEIPAVFVYSHDLARREWPQHIVESIYKAAGQSLGSWLPPRKRSMVRGYR